MNILERTIALFSPAAALRRARSFFAIDALVEHQRKYSSASTGRRNKNWQASSTSANTEIGASGNILRDRSRDLVRNNPYARRAITVIANNVVGTGIQPAIKVPTAKRLEKQLRQMWKDWAGKTGCDQDGLKTMYGIQKQAMRAVAESGECFIRSIRDRRAPGVPLRLQVMEADFLDTTRETVQSYTGQGSYVMQGIQFDANGRREGYWMWNQHPGEDRVLKGLTSNFVPADEIIHLFFQERPGQIRGVPFLVASMNRLHDHEEYEDAQLIRQKIAACFAIFVTDSSDPTPGATNTTGGAPLERVEPGIIEYLHPGKTVSFGNPPATENYDEYNRSVLQGIAAGSGVSYEAMTGNLREVNFSSGRMGWIEMQKQVEDWQWNMMVPILCERIFEWFILAARAVTANPNITAMVSWTPPRRQMIDPEKEGRAAAQMVSSHLASWQETVREFGYDPDELRAEIAADYEAFAAIGLDPPPWTTPPGLAPPPEVPPGTAPATPKKPKIKAS